MSDELFNLLNIIAILIFVVMNSVSLDRIGDVSFSDSILSLLSALIISLFATGLLYFMAILVTKWLSV